MIDYPILLDPYLKSVIWGGNNLSANYAKKNIDKLGESWELSVYPEKESIILNGKYKNRKLSDFLGNDYPVLIKLLNSALPLSVQVHPNKNEMWYVLDADSSSYIAYGLNSAYSKNEIKEAINKGKFESMLNYIYPQKGDIYYIPSGLVHALGPGLTVAEIQQTSDTTYRLYDYNRKDDNGNLRELHVDVGIKTIRNFSKEEIYRFRFSKSSGTDNKCLVNNDNFKVYNFDNVGSKNIIKEFDTAILIIDGYAKINEIKAEKGNCVFCPAGINLNFEGSFKSIITEIPKV